MKQQENDNKIKDQISNIKNAFQKSNIFNFLFVILLFAFCFLNLIYSYSISPIYYGFVNNDERSTVSFLQKIKDLPDYQKILEMNNNIYGSTIKEEIFRQENKKREMINNLEQKLLINPKARDVLYSLYKLYLQEGNNLQAQKYLEQVKVIDPGFISNIKN